MEITVTVRRTSLDRYSVVTHLRSSDGRRIARLYNVIVDKELTPIEEKGAAGIVHSRVLATVRDLLRMQKLF